LTRRRERLGTRTVQKRGFYPRLAAEGSIEWPRRVSHLLKRHLCDGDGESKGST
jgi:hypothetical protein